MKDSDEFSFLKETFKSLGSQYFDTSGIIIGPGDDAGLVENNKETIYSVDASVSGIHFPENLSPLIFKKFFSHFGQLFNKLKICSLLLET